MSGWNKKEGLLKDNKDINLFSVITHALLSKRNKTTTYKFCFLKSILDNVYKINDNEISFEHLSYTFSLIYWNMINVHKIPQMYSYEIGSRSTVERIIDKIVYKNPSVNNIRFESVPKDIQDEYQKLMLPVFKSYVIGAFHFETEGYLYGFDKILNKIYFNDKSITFLINHKIVLEQLCYYEWLKKCESILISYDRVIPNLITIFEEITLRKDLSIFKDKLDKLDIERVCFYSGVKSKQLSLDHVIPWSYIKTDDLWNLVWCSKSINSSKSDKVPSKKFIDLLIKRNIKYGIDMPNIKKIYDDAIVNGVEVWDKK